MVIAGFIHTVGTAYGFTVPLGQASRASRAANEIWFYLLMLVALTVVVVVVGLVARKYLAGPIEPSGGETVFDLSDLRRLHREGHLSDQEYQAARAAVLIDGNSNLGNEPQAQPTPPARMPEQPSDSHLDTPDTPDTELGPELLDRPHPTDAPGPDASHEGPDNPDGDPATDPRDDST